MERIGGSRPPLGTLEALPLQLGSSYEKFSPERRLTSPKIPLVMLVNLLIFI